MTTNPKYHHWFDLGVRKFRGLAEERGLEVAGEPLYPCPLCLLINGRGFTRAALGEGTLTAEDVPPESVGGKKILLTCKPCNNNQGSKIDRHAPVRERLIDSLTGVRVTPFAGEYTVGGMTARVEAWMSPGSIGIVHVPKRNNPNEFKTYQRALRDEANTKHHIHVDPGFIWGLADLSYIRAAYLASFAAFGWSQIFRPAFLPLVRRLAGFDDALPEAILRYDHEERSRENKMVLITEPGPQQGILLVQMRRAIVALPGPDDERTLGDVVAALMDLVPNGETHTFRGHLIPWPVRPEHSCDPDPRPGQLTA